MLMLSFFNQVFLSFGRCGNINFARRQRCNRCDAERPSTSSSDRGKKKMGIEIGKNAAEKSKGLFSAEDWQCGKCGNVNWARRSTCNVCNGPKFGDVEERTGLGGGFNEREDVRYKSHDSDSDEYDDFGRKKKKFRKSGDKKADKPTTNKVDEENEEEDEDGEGDLGKYDLWGDDENDGEETAGEKKNGSKNDSRKSRSRSREYRRRRSSRSRSSSR